MANNELRVFAIRKLALSAEAPPLGAVADDDDPFVLRVQKVGGGAVDVGAAAGDGDSVGRGAADEEVDAAGAGAGGFQGGGEDAAGGVADVGDVVGVGDEVGGLGRHRAQGEAAGQRK